MFTVAIPDIFESTEAPVIRGVICDLIDENMLPKPQRTEYQEVVKKMITPGTHDRKHHKASYLLNEDVLLVEMELKYGDNEGNWLRNDTLSTRPIFMDEALGIHIRPRYDRVIVTLTLTYHTSSLSRLRQWERTMLSDVRNGKDRLSHTISYQYSLDKLVYQWLSDLHKLREHQHGYGDDFSQYLKDHMTSATVVLQAGNDRQLAISEQQVSVHGYLVPPYIPQIQQVDDAKYAGTIGYEFSYSRPTGTYQGYPLMIHQQQVPDKYVTYQTKENANVFIESPVLRGIASIAHLKSTTSPNINIRIPDYDRTIIGPTHTGYQPLFTALIQLEAHTKGTILFNLEDLGDVELAEPVLEGVRTLLHERLHEPYLTVFLITVQRDGETMDLNYLRCDSELNIIANEDLDPRKTYRVSFSIITKLGLIPDEYIKLISQVDGLPALVTDTINSITMNDPPAWNCPNNFLIEYDFSYPMHVCSYNYPTDPLGHTITVLPSGGTAGLVRGNGRGLYTQKTVATTHIESSTL